MAQKSEAEKRSKSRVYYQTDILIKLESLEVKAFGSSRDISLNGIYVQTDDDLPLEASCIIEISLSGATENVLLNMQGTIVRKDLTGIGITFNSMDIDSYTHLKNIVRYNSPDPDIIY